LSVFFTFQQALKLTCCFCWDGTFFAAAFHIKITQGKNMEHSILIKIACTLTSVLFISSAASAVTFDIHELGTLGGTRTYANAINDSGQVTGYSYLNGDATYHAFLGNVGGLTDLGTLGGDLSVGYAINNSGKVVGFTRTAPNSFANTYFIGDANQLTDLGKPANTNYFAARGINDSGLISGYVGYQFGSSQLGLSNYITKWGFHRLWLY
jgi:probable HAF family extracellular repeat protein